MRSSADGQRSAYTDPAADAQNVPIFPTRIGGRVGISKWFDAAGDLSFLDAGMEFRVGLPEGTRPFPIALSLGLRSGDWGLLQMQNRTSTERRLRLEAYPRLGRLSDLRFNLISTFGASIGRRFHPSLLPNRFRDFENESIGPQFYPATLRDETRLEGSAGFELRHRGFFGSLVLMPYAVVASGHPASICEDCNQWQVARFHSNFGAALFVSFGMSFTSNKPDPTTAD